MLPASVRPMWPALLALLVPPSHFGFEETQEDLRIGTFRPSPRP